MSGACCGASAASATCSTSSSCQSLLLCCFFLLWLRHWSPRRFCIPSLRYRFVPYANSKGQWPSEPHCMPNGSQRMLFAITSKQSGAGEKPSVPQKRTGGGVGGVRHQYCAISSRRRGGLGKYYSKRLAAACTACLGMRPGMCAASAATDSYICIRSRGKLLYSRIAASSMTSSAKGVWYALL